MFEPESNAEQVESGNPRLNVDMRELTAENLNETFLVLFFFLLQTTTLTQFATNSKQLVLRHIST